MISFMGFTTDWAQQNNQYTWRLIIEQHRLKKNELKQKQEGRKSVICGKISHALDNYDPKRKGQR